MREERRLFKLRRIAIVALAAKFTQKRTAAKERTPDTINDTIKVSVVHRCVVGLEVLVARWHHAVTKVRAALRLNILAVAKRVSRGEIKFAVTAKAGQVQTQRRAVPKAVEIRIVVAERVA
ncbi:MAG: hypothetical protein VYC47_00780 [Verrucomicrobiota bacterium]|nr:hypothetical protein [Verrucomicrobiota bacterium]